MFTGIHVNYHNYLVDNNEVINDGVSAMDTEFTPDEIILFTRRFEEGNDIYDERYEQWKIKKNHA